MILASHSILTAYGFWLPNDPRGSWSDFVRNWELTRFGKATKITERHSVASRPHDHELRLSAKRALKYGAVRFTGEQARAIARGFARAIDEAGYRLFACAILHDHAHFVSERHARPVERIIAHLKARATQQLIAENLHPFVHLRTADNRFPSIWAHRAWKVFLDSTSDIARAINYVNNNPLKEGKNLQHWSFVHQYT